MQTINSLLDVYVIKALLKKDLTCLLLELAIWRCSVSQSHLVMAILHKVISCFGEGLSQVIGVLLRQLRKILLQGCEYLTLV